MTHDFEIPTGVKRRAGFVSCFAVVKFKNCTRLSLKQKVHRMTSLVTEVLLQAGKLDKDDLQTRVSKLSALSHEMKKKLREIIQNKYVEFDPVLLTCESLQKELTDQEGNVKIIEETLSNMVKIQLQDSTSEFEHLSKEYGRTSALLGAVKNICKLDELFDAFENSNNKSFKTSVQSLLEMNNVFVNLKELSMCDVNIFKALRMKYIILSETVMSSLDDEWRMAISWITPVDDITHTETILRIPAFVTSNKPVYAVEAVDSGNKALLEKEKMQDIVMALGKLNCLDTKVKKFADALVKHILSPLVMVADLLPEIKYSEAGEDCPKYVKLGLIKKGMQAAKESDSKSLPAQIFENTTTVLQCLSANLLCLKTKEDGEETLMTVFSDHIRDAFLQLLIDNCLALSVPKNQKELDNYKEVASLIKSYENSLRRIAFIPSQSDLNLPASELSVYALKVSFHFANRRCTDILCQARSLMLKDTHNTVEVNGSDIHEFGLLIKDKKDDTNPKDMRMVRASLKPSKSLSDRTLLLPKCRISQSVKGIMRLAYSILKEASLAEPQCAIRLVSTVQNIFELYAAIVPTYHKESLESVPQLSAVFYNDCMYLAHHLLTLGFHFSSLSSCASKIGKVMTFVDQVPILRRLGGVCYLAQLKCQNDHILQCLEPLRTFAVTTGADKHRNVEKAIKQVLHLLFHLKKIWNVLPWNTLRQSLYKLVNSMIKELTAIICTMEDISEDDSMSLKLLCELLSEQIPQLFRKDEEEVEEEEDMSWQKQVSKSSRLSEMIIFLSSNLKEIVSRWSEGKGPLAVAFTITEVKGLIRALFQNTEHRAQAIMQIRI